MAHDNMMNQIYACFDKRLARFVEDERPIPELPGTFEVRVDGIELDCGPFQLVSCGQHRLTCRHTGRHIDIEHIEVKIGREWTCAEDHSDERVRFIAQLIRDHYDRPSGQSLLKLECAAQDEEIDAP